MDTKHNSVHLDVPAPERSSRWLALGTLLLMIPKTIILIPHFIVLWFLGVFAFFVGMFAQVAVLGTGKYPMTMHRIVVGVIRWQVRVNVFLFGLRDEYPPFTFDD